MQVVTAPAAMQRRALAWKRKGVRVGFVPTMGFLHEGHVSLMRRARRTVGRNGVVIASIYVNPTQFGPKEDLGSYPRDLANDKRLCRATGVDVLFVPTDATMYPGKESGCYSTYVVEERLTRHMEGASRPAHFRGVTTIVAKLFNLVLPDVAVFGAKDWQQAAVIRRMAGDLNLPVKILVAPTVRERDGLAMSSRNKYLSPGERAQATALWAAIGEARRRVRAAGPGLAAEKLRGMLQATIEQHPAARVDYLEFFDGQTLEPVEKVRRGTHMALAVFVGKTRLIDNARLA